MAGHFIQMIGDRWSLANPTKTSGFSAHPPILINNEKRSHLKSPTCTTSTRIRILCNCMYLSTSNPDDVTKKYKKRPSVD